MLICLSVLYYIRHAYSSHVFCVHVLFSQYVVNTTYKDSDASLYLSSFTEGTKDSNYTLLVDADTQAPILLEFVGYDRLFGSHYDKYIIQYSTFISGPLPSSIFDVPNGEACIGTLYACSVPVHNVFMVNLVKHNTGLPTLLIQGRLCLFLKVN